MVINQEYLTALVILIGGIFMFALTLVIIYLKEENKSTKEVANPNRSVNFLVTKKYKSSLSPEDFDKVVAVLQTTGNTYVYN